MTKNELKNRIVRVKGLVLKDPWGTRALVDRLVGDTVWLWYDGIEVPFQRTLDLMVDAANGLFLADRSDQFVKRLVFEAGVSMTFHYEPNWVQTARTSERAVAGPIDPFSSKLTRPIKKRTKR